MEEMSRINPNLAVAVLVQNVAGSILYEYGTPEQREMARDTISGRSMVAITVTEPEAGNDVQNVKTTATRRGDVWVLDGLKSFITLGGDADVLVTLAQTEPGSGRKGMQFFAVDRRSRGVAATQIDAYVNRPAPTYRVAFDRVEVPESRRIPAGFREIMAGFNRERIMVPDAAPSPRAVSPTSPMCTRGRRSSSVRATRAGATSSWRTRSIGRSASCAPAGSTPRTRPPSTRSTCTRATRRCCSATRRHSPGRTR